MSRSYGRCFAEFLNKGSPVHLGLLALSTCVGLRYGYHTINLRSFSRHPAHPFSPPENRGLQEVSWADAGGFTYPAPSTLLPESNNREGLLGCVTPSNGMAGQEY